ncbi:DNA-directed RNA polymerase [Lambiella insularis]|nr:DNA-directed RNA polymerase [Lambiella insularis]
MYLGTSSQLSNKFNSLGSVRHCLELDFDVTVDPLPLQEHAALYGRPHARRFAYAADPITSNDNYIPFDHFGLQNPVQTQPLNAWSSGDSLSGLSNFDPASPLVIHDSLRQTPRRFRDNKGIGGEVSEIQQTLLACVQVGRLERAAATVKRFNMIYKLDAPELIKIHNNFLASLIERLVRTKDQKLLRDIQRWFEVEIRGQGIAPNSTTYGLMLRAAFQESNQVKIDRTIRRYLALADEACLSDETLASALSIINLQEFGRVTSVYQNTLPNANDFSENIPFEVQPFEVAPSASRLPQDVELRPQQQKGLGLTALKKALSVFSDNAHVPGTDGDYSQVALHPSLAYTRQQSLERDTLSSALDRWREEHNESLKRMGLNTGLQTKSVGAIMWAWHEALVPLIRHEIIKANEAETKKDVSKAGQNRTAYGPFLQYISPEKMSAVTIIHILNRMSRNGIERGTKITHLVSTLGKAIQEESVAELVKDRPSYTSRGVAVHERQKQLMQLIKRRLRYNTSPQVANDVNGSLADNEPSLNVHEDDWAPAIRAQLGAVLVSLLIQSAKLDVVHRHPETGESSKESQPVFWNSYEYANGRRYGVIRVNAAMSAKLTKEPLAGALSKHLPMLVEPVPWTKYKQGGFLQAGVPVVRAGTQHSQLREYIRAAADSGDMNQVFAGLDVLGKTPWHINHEVFTVMREVWNSGEALANIPAENPKFDYPAEPGPSADISERRVHAFKIKAIENARDGFHSERCFLNFQLEVAQAYLNETFFFPHNVDFRGRAYPIPPYLNHIGADNCRGLLKFGKGKELGESGLAWLKIHLANVFGYDKASFQERRDFAMNHLKDVYDSASNPLKGERWWLKAEAPWQCLATCVELKNALDSPDPTKFVSYLPVHQDGTCNGLQHYAALGGDAIGAKQVNLEPGDRPSDIYTAVAELVKDDIARDAAGGHQLAKLLKDKITRKVVKPTVMTNVYGVTYQGAKRQVAGQLRDLYPDLTSDARHLMTVSSYITKKIFAALAAMFNGAHDIQFWLGECASRICEALTPEQVQWIEDSAAGKVANTPYASKATNEKNNKNEHTRFRSSVIWTTPLKMPVVQPYRTTKARVIKTNLQMISLNEPSACDPVSKRKQLQGFPPNFIHSLDATHMLLSALKCNEMGLSFAAVHDSFWTHAADLDTMNGVLRDAFINMHSEDIIGRLAAEFSARYKDCMYLAHVKSNSPLGKKITAIRRSTKEARKTKAQNQIDELLAERSRLRLLSSKNPEERVKGEAMVTPGKLFAETADQNDLITVEELHGLDGAIGQVSTDDSADTEDIGEPIDNDDVIKAMQPIRGSSKIITEAALLADTESATSDDADFMNGIEEKKARLAANAKKARITRKTWFWLPLTFPPVPKKGSFEVSRLKDSKYFFS